MSASSRAVTSPPYGQRPTSPLEGFRMNPIDLVGELEQRDTSADSKVLVLVLTGYMMVLVLIIVSLSI